MIKNVDDLQELLDHAGVNAGELNDALTNTLAENVPLDRVTVAFIAGDCRELAQVALAIIGAPDETDLRDADVFGAFDTDDVVEILQLALTGFDADARDLLCENLRDATPGRVRFLVARGTQIRLDWIEYTADATAPAPAPN